MAEAVGLAVGLAALFSTCVEAFDIVVSAKDCSREYEELSALLGLQQARFALWGMRVGLQSGNFDGIPVSFNENLELPQIRPAIERALDNIRHLLGSVADIDGRYGVTVATSEEGTTLRGTNIFHSLQKLKAKIRKGQKDKSVLKVTRWALHDGARFRDTVARLTALIDGLRDITEELGLLPKHVEVLDIHALVNEITNEEDMKLLSDATSKSSGTSIHRAVSDFASIRLSVMTASIIGETRTQPQSTASLHSFYTAKTRPSEQLETVGEADESTEGSLSRHNRRDDSMWNEERSCAECDEAGEECSTIDGVTSCVSCTESEKQCSYDLANSISSGSDRYGSLSLPLGSTPQHERLLAESASRTRAEPIPLSFEAGDEHHGDHMSAIDSANLHHWVDKGHELIAKASRGNSATKRMLWELRNINKAKVPFVSATEIEDDVSRLLASIEGPPNTPYEGGIFWILVLASSKTPPEAPTLRFLTKIYHPNIDHRTGKLCADYQQKWNPSKVSASMKGHLGESATLWSERTSPNQWTLLALLIAICALLASPNAEDPLIPEIAQKFVEDPKGYYEAAKMWTKRYAIPKIPELSSFGLAEALSLQEAVEVSDNVLVEQECINEPSISSVELMEYLRWRFEEKYISNAVLCVRKLSTWSTATEHSTLEAVIADFLGRDRPQLRQITLTESGERLSDIEQWRIAREIRLEARKHMEHYSPEKSGRFSSLHESQIRRAIHNSFVESWGTRDNGKYIELVKKSFFNCSRNSERFPIQEKRSSSSSTPRSHSRHTKAYRPHPQSRTRKGNHNSVDRYYYASPRDLPVSTDAGLKKGGSSPPASPARRRSNSQKAPEDIVTDFDEYLDSFVDGILYRMPLGLRSASKYSASDWLKDTESQTSQYISSSRIRQQSSSIEPGPTSARPTTAPKLPLPAPKATEADARKHRIPPGFSLKNWDPSEKPIMLLGSVFDANSLGKWIYDWTAYHHGPGTPIADMAGELWLLLIQLAGKVKRAEETTPRIRAKENLEMVEDFIESEERLMDKLKKLLKSCEAPILKAAKKDPTALGKNAGTNFIDSFFGRDRQLESTEKFMSSIRLWNLRFDANCEDILRRPGQVASDKYTSTQTKFVMTSVSIRTAFGLEDIFEDDDEA